MPYYGTLIYTKGNAINYYLVPLYYVHRIDCSNT